MHPCGFRIHAGHFAERHGLVVIIALGESIVAAGVGVLGLALGTGVIAAVVVGIALAAALWIRAGIQRTPSRFSYAENGIDKLNNRTNQDGLECTAANSQ